ncbi:MAG: DUF72 domain-containing protein [bacterium]
MITSSKSSERPVVYVGMGGWDLPPFDGRFYPARQAKDFRKLEFYSQFFDMVEVNATFYNTSLSARQSKRWLIDVASNEQFIFTVKLFRGFTHTFDATLRDVTAVLRMLEPLAADSKLGGVVIQFPYSFTRTSERQEYLQKLSRTFGEHTLFLELRNNSWNKSDLTSFFQEQNFHLVNVDLPKIKQHMPFRKSAWDGFAYFRMMGRNARTWDRKGEGERYDYFYSAQELSDITKRIESILKVAHTRFAVFHNDPKANSVVNGLQLRYRLQNDQRVIVPATTLQAFPLLEAISMPGERVEPELFRPPR